MASNDSVKPDNSKLEDELSDEVFENGEMSADNNSTNGDKSSGDDVSPFNLNNEYAFNFENYLDTIRFNEKQKYLAIDAVMFNPPSKITAKDIRLFKVKEANKKKSKKERKDEAAGSSSLNNTERPTLMNDDGEGGSRDNDSNDAQNEEQVNNVNDGIMSSRPKYSDSKQKENINSKTEIKTMKNTRALGRDADTYELETFEKNAMLILNQIDCYGYLPRVGSRKDGADLRRTFENLKFEVEEEFDLCRKELFEKLKTFSSRDFTNYGCIVVAILTHGWYKGSLRAKDKEFFESDVINFFKTTNKPTLVTKPIIFIVQACRGKRMSESMSLENPIIRKDNAKKDLNYHLPLECDMLFINSSYHGKLSIRNEIDGSWFIQTLCKKIDELSATDDMERIMTKVKKFVAIEMELEEHNRKTDMTEIYKQMPTVQSTLIRLLYFKTNTQNQEISETKTTREVPLQKPIHSFSPAQCLCKLDLFEYLRKCLRHFIEKNPSDDQAKCYLELADEFTDKSEFDKSKKTISKLIRNHLETAARGFEFYNFIYFYKEV